MCVCVQLLLSSGELVTLSVVGAQLERVFIDRALLGRLPADTISHGESPRRAAWAPSMHLGPRQVIDGKAFVLCSFAISQEEPDRGCFLLCFFFLFHCSTVPFP